MEVVTVIHDERTIIQENDFRYESSASLRRITPSTQVGRLSGSHSDIGFQLAQFPAKWRWNGKVAESEEKYC